MIVADIVGLLLPFFGLILIGYGAARITKQPVEAMGWLNTFIIYAALPALFFKLVSKTPVEELARMDFVAASLACGLLGMMDQLEPSEPVTGTAYNMPYDLPRTLEQALRALQDCTPLREILGERFVRAFNAVKENEHGTFLQVISSWEREHLLLNV